MYTYIYIYIHVHIHIHMHTSLSLSIYIFIYIYIHRERERGKAIYLSFERASGRRTHYFVTSGAPSLERKRQDKSLVVLCSTSGVLEVLVTIGQVAGSTPRVGFDTVRGSSVQMGSIQPICSVVVVSANFQHRFFTWD